MIKHVILDLGKVLIDFDFAVALRSLEKLFPVDVLKLAKLFHTSTLADDLDRGMISPEEFFQAVQKTMNFPISMEDFVRHWNAIFTEKKEMVDLALKIKKMVPVTILTNTNPWHLEELRKNHSWVFGFQDVIASCEVRLLKPDPKIYRLALERTNALPEEVFYTDDISENVSAARKLGIQAVQFKDYASFLSRLTRAGLSVI